MVSGSTNDDCPVIKESQGKIFILTDQHVLSEKLWSCHISANVVP